MKKTIILFFFKGIGALTSLLLGMLISKNYGVDVLGNYALALSYILIFSIIATWGANFYVIEYKKNIIDIRFFLFWVFFSTIISIISALFFYYKFDFFYLGIVVFIYSFLIYKSSYFMVEGYQYYNALVDDFFKYVLPILLLIFFSSKMDFFELFFLSQVLLFVIGFSIFFKVTKIKSRFSETSLVWRESFLYGFMPTISALLVLLNAQFDRVILSLIVSDEMLGIYYTAQMVMSLVTYMAVSVMMVITPNIIKLYEDKSLLELKRICKRYSIFLTLISLSVLLFFSIFGNLFFKLYNITSSEGYSVLLILLCGITISQVFGFGMTIYSYSNCKKRLIIYQFFTFFLTTLLCFILSKFYGIVGAALATAFGLVLIKVLIWFDFRKKGIQLGII